MAVIHSSGQTVFSFPHIEGITLGASEEVDELAGGAIGMGVDWIGEIGDRAVKDRLLECMTYRTCWTPQTVTPTS